MKKMSKSNREFLVGLLKKVHNINNLVVLNQTDGSVLSQIGLINNQIETNIHLELQADHAQRMTQHGYRP